jgi:hypothetical protein
MENNDAFLQERIVELEAMALLIAIDFRRLGPFCCAKMAHSFAVTDSV